MRGGGGRRIRERTEKGIREENEGGGGDGDRLPFIECANTNSGFRHQTLEKLKFLCCSVPR